MSVGLFLFFVFTEKQRRVYIQSVPVCTFKTLPCVPSKRPCHIRHGRFDGTHGSVLKVHPGAFSKYTREPPRQSLYLSPSLSLSPSLPLSLVYLSSHVCLSYHVYLSSHVSPSLLIPSRTSLLLLSLFTLSNLSLSLLISLSLVASLSVLNDDDNEHSSGWVSLYTRL